MHGYLMSKNCLFPEHKSWIDFLTKCFIAMKKSPLRVNLALIADVFIHCDIN